jgi:CBS domain-containing protein
MVREVATLPAEMPIEAATAFFADPTHHHRSYPVVDKNGILVGLVERADALTWRGSADLADQTLFDIVSDASVPVAQPGSTAGQVIDLMIAHDTGRVPVVESSGKLVGLIARKDLLRLRAAGTTSERQRQVFFPRPRRS